MKKLIISLLTLGALSAFAGNGEVGSAGDGIFSKTETLHEPYNVQTQSQKMPNFCEALIKSELDLGNCDISCVSHGPKVSGMVVKAPGFKKRTLYFQNEDKTLITYWGEDEQHEYLNSKDIYMNAWIHLWSDGPYLTLNLMKDQQQLLYCGPTYPRPLK